MMRLGSLRSPAAAAVPAVRPPNVTSARSLPRHFHLLRSGRGGAEIANGIALVAREIPTYAEAAPLVHAMSFLFLLKWPHEIRARMLERALDWRRLRLLQAAGLLAVALTSILMALAGAGAYALAVVSETEPERIILAREGCPVVIGLGVDENFVASDVAANASATSSGVKYRRAWR